MYGESILCRWKLRTCFFSIQVFGVSVAVATTPSSKLGLGVTTDGVVFGTLDGVLLGTNITSFEQSI
jgi:hypothetical protein